MAWMEVQRRYWMTSRDHITRDIVGPSDGGQECEFAESQQFCNSEAFVVLLWFMPLDGAMEDSSRPRTSLQK